MTTHPNVDWQKLRSDIYIRDRGICWVCNAFTPLDEYELGHLIDRCNGGQDDYDNLAVMHKSCNGAKPFHKTLEETVKWKLTNPIPAKAYIPQQPRGSYHKRNATPPANQPSLIPVQSVAPIQPVAKKPTKKHRNRNLESLDQQLARIKPGTIVWIQGRTLYKDDTQAPMWKVLPPPYKQEDLFSMRQTPPGAIDNGENGVYETIQILNGVLSEDIHLNMGLIHFYIYPNGNGVSVKCGTTPISNCGTRSQTIGEGAGQIPIELWKQAKRQGMTLSEFKAQFTPPVVPYVTT